MTKFKFYLYAKRSIEQIIEIPDDELTGLTIEDKQKYIRDKYFEDWVGDFAELGFCEIDSKKNNGGA